MEEVFERIETLSAQVKAYANARIDAAKLELAEKISSLLSNLIAGAIAVLVFLVFFLFLNFSIAYMLADLTGKTWIGFLIVAAFYLLIAVVVWVAREKIIRIPVMNSILKELFKAEADEDERD
ncbi:MAG TPA: phage holin family protein [Ferruginibacter sp.]|nr:phage holin family protein [Ferruginibacter sp.]HMP19341.1 phage holin family protein [Ferruginibacter sp.]